MRAPARYLAKKARRGWFDVDDAESVYKEMVLKRRVRRVANLNYSILDDTLGWWDTPHSRDVLLNELTIYARKWAAKILWERGYFREGRDYGCPECLSSRFKAGVLESDDGVFECRSCKERFQRPVPLWIEPIEYESLVIG